MSDTDTVPSDAGAQEPHELDTVNHLTHNNVEITQTEADATYQQDDLGVQLSSTDYNRLSVEDLAQVLKLAAAGRTQRQIAEAVGCSQPTISYTLQRFKTSQADIQSLLKADALSHITNWKKASAKAADRGDHRPAREAIEAAYPELRPQQGEGAGRVGVTINIGQPGSPISVPLTIETTAIESESE